MNKIFLVMAMTLVSLSFFEASHAGPGYRREQVQCGSVDYRYRECGSGSIVKVMDARLIQQQSKSACQKGHSWGKSSRGIWVDKGCRGVFEIVGFSL